jgi:hypothetical protein
MMAIELASAEINRLFEKFAGRETTLTTDMEKKSSSFPVTAMKRHCPLRSLVLMRPW